jgi:maltose O-acetyltransferase
MHGAVWPKLREEIAAFRPRLVAANIAGSVLPPFVGSRIRAQLLRMAGLRIGRGTMFFGQPTILGEAQLSQDLVIGKGCIFNLRCFLEVGARIEIGDHAALGPEAMILTTTHSLPDSSSSRRAAARYAKPVTIGSGAWLGARCVILPGVTVGRGAVVGAGALVNRDVEANALVAGSPARLIRYLDEHAQSAQDRVAR